jgi:hypothetical protein
MAWSLPDYTQHKLESILGYTHDIIFNKEAYISEISLTQNLHVDDHDASKHVAHFYIGLKCCVWLHTAFVLVVKFAM